MYNNVKTKMINYLLQTKNKAVEYIKNNPGFDACFLVFFSLFKYDSILEIPIFHFIYITLPFYLCIILLIYFFFIKKKKPSVLLISLMVFSLWMAVDRLRYYGFSIAPHRLSYYQIDAGLLIELFYKEDYENLLTALLCNCEIAIYLDTITKLFNLMNGLPKEETFTGYYNNTLLFALPAICVAALYIKMSKKYTRGTILIITSVILCFLSTAGTPKGGILAFFMVVIMENLLFYKLKATKKRIWVWVLLAVVFNVFVLFLYRPGTITFLDSFITNVLHRSTDFSGRTTIWNKAIESIIEHPIIGIGYKISAPNMMHAHNMYLEILMEYGIIGLALFAGFNYLYISEIDKKRDDFMKIIFVALIFSMFISFIIDYYSRFHLFVIMILMIYYYCVKESDV